MLVSYIKLLILRPECVARHVKCAGAALSDKDLYSLWSLAKLKANYIEHHSNYHPDHVTVHLSNEKILRKLFEKRIEDNVREH
jgi:hypothetical protein